MLHTHIEPHVKIYFDIGNELYYKFNREDHLRIVIMPDGLHMWDKLNLLSKFNLTRILNACKLVFSFYFSRLQSMPWLQGEPMSLSIEPTTSCNLRCPQCPSGLRSFTRPTGMIDEQFFRQIIDEHGDYLLYLMLYFQGEPFLHSKFCDLVKHAAARNIYTATSTNAHYIDEQMAEKIVESGLDRLIISMDGLRQETYEQYRVGGNLKKVLSGIHHLNTIKKQVGTRKPHLILQFLVFRFNEHEISKVRAFGATLGLEVRIKTAQVYDAEKSSTLIPEATGYSRYKANGNGGYQLDNELYNHCWKMWHSAVITWDGRVVPCCFDKDADHEMGQLNGQSLKKIWHSDTYQAFRKRILKERKNIDICKNCSEGTRIWI